MFTLAITGGLGAGKSTASRFFAQRGAVVVALDEVAREALESDPRVLAEVVAHFGDSVVDAAGRLDRTALAGIAFHTADAAHTLNSIVHPAAIQAARQRLTAFAARSDAPAFVVLDIPLLAEAPELLDSVDKVLAIEAPVEARVARAAARGMDEPDARRRIACQATDADRAAIADSVIHNDGDIASFEAQLARLLEEWVAPHVGLAR